MASMVAESLEEIGVVFMKQMQAVSVKLNKSEDKLQVTYKSWQPNKNTGAPETTAKEEFDTVLFAVGTKVFAEELDLKKFNVKLDLQSKLLAYNEQTQVNSDNLFGIFSKKDASSLVIQIILIVCLMAYRYLTFILLVMHSLGNLRIVLLQNWPESF